MNLVSDFSHFQKVDTVILKHICSFVNKKEIEAMTRVCTSLASVGTRLLNTIRMNEQTVVVGRVIADLLGRQVPNQNSHIYQLKNTDFLNTDFLRSRLSLPVPAMIISVKGRQIKLSPVEEEKQYQIG